ncbi:hypothetical protein CONLIGDRAFT_403390 [Coniochaeta ligniaria NRRL 30616]|uniref:Uncharacterized protein n=1 Tax=Coniochaeta ligniaria NRRL 30616 TaxID=1408157 RepID=A0A1J7INP9_9PEZI|nr:hypothetical protein CONLIGDRAFT_403390 [Coniochaeta ligniaria NRRL 30616]
MMNVMVKGQIAHESAPGVVDSGCCPSCWCFELVDWLSCYCLHVLPHFAQTIWMCGFSEIKNQGCFYRSSFCHFPEPSLEPILYEARGQRLRQTNVSQRNFT